jgi:hypothetical protein
MATASADRPRVRLTLRQLGVLVALGVVGNLWAAWLGVHVSNAESPAAKADGIITLRKLPENPHRLLIRRAVIALAMNAVILTGLACTVLANYLEDVRRRKLGLPLHASERRIFARGIRARTDSAGGLAPVRISRHVRPGVRVDLKCHLRPRTRIFTRPSS